MGRGMHGDQAYAYRAVITTTTVDGPDVPLQQQRDPRVYVEHAGPFATIGAARAAVTRERYQATRHSGRYGAHTVTATYERAPLMWETIA